MLTGKLTGPGEFQDPDLARLIDAWPNLPEPLKAAILAVIEAVAGPTSKFTQ